MRVSLKTLLFVYLFFSFQQFLHGPWGQLLLRGYSRSDDLVNGPMDHIKNHGIRDQGPVEQVQKKETSRTIVITSIIVIEPARTVSRK